MPELALKKQVLGLRTASFWLCPLKSGTVLGCKQLYDMLARGEHVMYFFFLSLKFLFKLVPVNIIKTKQNKTTKKTYRIWDLAVLFHWHCLVPTCVASPPQTYCDGRFLPLLSKKKKVWPLLYASRGSPKQIFLHPSCQKFFHHHQSLADPAFLLLASTNHLKG